MKSTFQTGYPTYNVLDKWSSPDFDDQTREVIRKRLQEVPPIRFFTAHEAATLEAVANCLVPQPDRRDLEKIPIVPWIDEKLFHDQRNGYRYEELPAPREAWRLGLKGIDETAQQHSGGNLFTALDDASQKAVLKQVECGSGKGETWKLLSAKRFFKSVLLITVVKIYYAHPLAWSEIGYSGPSSPRGHFRKWEGGIDPWEAHEKNNGK